MPTPGTRHTRALHERRNGHVRPPEIAADPELRAAWHSLQLHWLQAYPEYRQALRARVAEAARRAEQRSQRVDSYYAERDYLGREVEGCG